jgi:ferredoxin--NADP+ reductase
VVEVMATDLGQGRGAPGAAGLDALLGGRGIRATSFADWQALDAHEIARARPDAPREKLTSLDEMLGLLP